MAWSEWEKRSAYLMVQSDWKGCERAWKLAKSWPEAIGVWKVTGNWGLVVWVDARSIDDVYDKACALRGLPGVTGTSTHFVHKGTKNGKWWWDWKAGAWAWLRSPHLNGEIKDTKKWKWAGSVASVPGEWDYLAWVGGDNWDQVWKGVEGMNEKGWRTETLVPIKSWWNKSWKKEWWAEAAAR